MVWLSSAQLVGYNVSENQLSLCLLTSCWHVYMYAHIHLIMAWYQGCSVLLIKQFRYILCGHYYKEYTLEGWQYELLDGGDFCTLWWVPKIIRKIIIIAIMLNKWKKCSSIVNECTCTVTNWVCFYRVGSVYRVFLKLPL